MKSNGNGLLNLPIDFDVLEWLPLLAILVLTVAAWFGLQVWARHKKHRQTYSRYHEQSLRLFVVLLAITLLIVAAPIEADIRSQLLSLLGLLASAVLALSSTTVMGNLMAGIMLRTVKSFSLGDFVRIQGQLGRVSAIGLLHVEVQTEDSDLLTIPNLVLVQQPFTVVRASGTMIQCEVSLGYDVSRHDVEKALLQAVDRAELEDGFIEIKALGDFSILYSVHARLKDTGKLVSSRSRLKGAVMDALHEAGIEIVSPAFMNQRQLDSARKIIPPRKQVVKEAEATPIEEVMFDKADRAEMIRRLEKRLGEIQQKRQALDDSKPSEAVELKQHEELQKRLKRRQAQVEFLLDELKEKLRQE